MNKNCLGVAKCNENVHMSNPELPQGFVVRERVVNGKFVSLEYGIYLNNDGSVFLGIPLHFSLKSKLIMHPSYHTADYNYYLVPQDMQFAVSTYTNKRTNKVNPILVAPTENNPAVFIACLATSVPAGNIITDVKFEDDDSLVIRKYIDKDRRYIGIIAMDPDKDVINPKIPVRVYYGVPKSTDSLGFMSYNFDVTLPAGFEKVTGIADNGNKPIATKFINLKQLIEPQIKVKVNNREKTEE